MLLSHKLLALDGSAHLQTYHRSLGPYRAQRTNEAIKIEALETNIKTHGEIPFHSTNGLVLLPKDPNPPTNTTTITEPTQPPYPAALASALLTATSHSSSACTPSTAYQVIEYAESASKVTVCHTISQHATRHEANSSAASYFFTQGHWASDSCAEAVIMQGGMLCCSSRKDGAQTVVYVRGSV
jgi:hypothetical protein